MSLAVIMNWVTEAFRKSTNIDPESAEVRSLLALISSRPPLISGESYQSLRLSPPNHCQHW